MLSVQDVWYRYGSSTTGWTLSKVNLNLASGELLGLLGPSGCGKTTLLRLIAGFEQPSHGSISLFGHPVASEQQCVPAERRDVGMVFQDGALFPHLTVWQNACFGLKTKEPRERVQWLLELLGIASFVDRYPHELSGGQRQRLALARSLAPAPRLLLLDEPFSNLDVEVRLQLRKELPSVLQECRVTAVMVTHDPEEALAICHHVGVMRAGVILQLDAPQQLVQRPANSFVARFVLGANLLPVYWHQEQWHTCLGPLDPRYGLASAEHELMVPADSMKLRANDNGRWRVQRREFLGHSWRYGLAADGATMSVIDSLQQSWQPGDTCDLIWQDQERAVLLRRTD